MLCRQTKTQLYKKIIELQDEVALHLKENPDVDEFIDKTDIFDEWENILPEAEFPIFVITILNNIKSNTVIESIIESILENKNEQKPKRIKASFIDVFSDDHPFC